MITSRAVLTATRPAGPGAVREVHQFEVPSATEWAFQRLEPIFRPNLFVDVGATIDRKVEAMAVYESEGRPFPHPRSAQALHAIAQRWGSVTGLPAAEAFETIRVLRPAGGPALG
jgi:LmbE family N-acetylglucosaminyl deacetylase